MGTPPFSRTAVIVLMRVSNDSFYFVSTTAKLAWVVMTDVGRERRSLLGRGPFVLENLASWPIRWTCHRTVTQTLKYHWYPYFWKGEKLAPSPLSLTLLVNYQSEVTRARRRRRRVAGGALFALARQKDGGRSARDDVPRGMCAGARRPVPAAWLPDAHVGLLESSAFEVERHNSSDTRQAVVAGDLSLERIYAHACVRRRQSLTDARAPCACAAPTNSVAHLVSYRRAALSFPRSTRARVGSSSSCRCPRLRGR